MRKGSRTSADIVNVAIMHFELAINHSTESAWDQRTTDAVCMRLSAGIEALSHLEEEDREKIMGDLWPLMWGMRNRIAHGYVLVSSETVRRTVESDLPAILEVLRLHPID